MLEQTSLTPRIMFDLVAGALDARLYPATDLGRSCRDPFTKTPAVLPQAIMLPGLIWLAAGVLNFEPLEGFFSNTGVGILTVLSPLVALLLSATALFGVRLERREDSWSGTITVRRRYGHVTAFAISAALTLTFAGYLLTQAILDKWP